MGAVGISCKPISGNKTRWSSKKSINLLSNKCDYVRTLSRVYMASIAGVIFQLGKLFTVQKRKWQKDGTWLTIHDKLVPLG